MVNKQENNHYVSYQKFKPNCSNCVYHRGVNNTTVKV